MAKLRKLREEPQIANESKFISMIEAKYGENIIERDEDIPLRSIKVIPTGSISLDISTGIGGIPRGKFTEIYGPESSAKTSLCLSISKNAIAMGLRVLYVEPENTLDHQYIKAIAGSFDTSKFVLAQPETGEQALQICEAGVKSKEFQLIILDSVAALAPEAVLEDELGKSHVGLLARILGPFLQRNGYAVRNDEVAFVFVNQIRANIGTYMGGFDSPGGHALKHMLALRIQLNRKDTIEVVHDKDNKEAIGINCRFLIKKNKVAKPFRTFFFPFMFEKGIDSTADLVNFAEMLRILDKKGSYYAFEGSTLGQGLAKTVEFLNNTPETLDKIKNLCYNSIIKEGKEMPVDVDDELEETTEEIEDGTVA